MNSLENTIKWYPWLNYQYRNIINSYQQERGHHALLIHSPRGNGVFSMFYALSRWLICNKPKGIKSCGQCYSCKLMKANNHPDYYHYESKNSSLSIGIDNIRNIIEFIHGKPCEGRVKVVLLQHIELMTEQAANALLKTLEEPPVSTYFILGCHDKYRLLPTLISRCLYWKLLTPNEKIGINWIKKYNNYPILSLITALRLCEGAPVNALKFLNSIRWKERIIFCTSMSNVIVSRNFISLLPIINIDKYDGPLYWLLSLLIDSLKLKYEAKEFLINLDQHKLINDIAESWSYIKRQEMLKNLFYCLYQLQDLSSGLNRELLIINQLINWN